MSILNRKEIEQQLITRAAEDASFKQELIDNPQSAFTQAGISLPESLTVKVYEETADTLYLILPQNATQELSEAELESVVGGGYDQVFCSDAGC